jgi:hypothetical protein
MNKNYLLISDGPKGNFKYQFDDLGTAIAAAKDHLTAGNTCSIYMKHSDLVLDQVTVVKSDIQLEIEAKEAKAAEVEAAEATAEIDTKLP